MADEIVSREWLESDANWWAAEASVRRRHSDEMGAVTCDRRAAAAILALEALARREEDKAIEGKVEVHNGPVI